MKDVKKEFVSAEEYQPYLQNGRCHSFTDREMSTNYFGAFYGAYLGSFPQKRKQYEVIYEKAPEVITEEQPVVVEAEDIPEEPIVEVEEEPVVEVEEEPAVEVEEEPEDVAVETVEVEAPAEPAVVVEAAPVEKKKVVVKRKARKNFASMIITFLSSLLAVVLAALSAFNILTKYTNFFYTAGTKEVFKFLVNANVAGRTIPQTIVIYSVPCTAILAAIMIVATLVVALVAIGCRKKVRGVGAPMLVALVAWFDCGVLAYFGAPIARESDAIMAYINPMVNGGIAWGYYIMFALLLIGTICGFCCYKRKK